MPIHLFMFNPMATSLRGIQQASELAKVQRKVTNRRPKRLALLNKPRQLAKLEQMTAA